MRKATEQKEKDIREVVATIILTIAAILLPVFVYPLVFAKVAVHQSVTTNTNTTQRCNQPGWPTCYTVGSDNGQKTSTMTTTTQEDILKAYLKLMPPNKSVKFELCMDAFAGHGESFSRPICHIYTVFANGTMLTKENQLR